MKSQIRVVGNLALAPVEEHRFTVIDGSAAQKAVAPSRPQLFAPIAYPSRTVLEGAKMTCIQPRCACGIYLRCRHYIHGVRFLGFQA